MKKLTFKLLSLLVLVILLNTGNATNCIVTNNSKPCFNLPQSSVIFQQHAKPDTTSFWFVTNGYYITFTKDTIPGEWVYKANKPAASVKTPDPSKKAPATVAASSGPMIRISLGKKTFLFRNMPSNNTLRYMTAIPSQQAPPGAPGAVPTPPSNK